METDRLLHPSQDIQKAIETLWMMIHKAGDSFAARQQADADTLTRISYLESEIETKDSAIQSQAATIESWKAEIATIDELRASMKALYEKLNDTQSALSDRDARVASLEDDLRREREQSGVQELMQKELDKVNEDRQAWQTRAQNLEQTLQERSVQLSRLQEALEESEELYQKLSDESAQLRADNHQFREELRSLTEHSQRQHDSAVEYKGQLDEMIQRMYETEKQLILAEERLKSLDELRAVPSDTPTLIEGMLRSELDDARERIRELQAALQLHENTPAAPAAEAPSPVYGHIADSLRQSASVLASATDGTGSANGGVHFDAEQCALLLQRLQNATGILQQALATT